MKSKLSLAAGCILLLAANSYAQRNGESQEIRIDPRQYVIVQYRKTPAKGKVDTIWNWENRKNVPNQKFHFIDVDGEIKIDFNRQEIVANTNFEGTVSLEAEISGLNGTRKIEVNPYSEIGVQRIPIGIKAEPASEIAKKTLNMIRELEWAEYYYNLLYAYSEFTQENINKNAEIRAMARQLDSFITDSATPLSNARTKVAELKRMIKSEAENVYFDDSIYGPAWDASLSAARSKDRLQSMADDIYSAYNAAYKTQRKGFVDDYTEAFNFAREELGIIISYLSSFDDSGEDALKAFLSVINKDYINYEVLKTKLAGYKDEINGIKLSRNIDSTAIILSDNSALLGDVLWTLSSFSKFKGSELENILRSLAGNRISYQKQYTSEQRDSVDTKVFFELINENIEFLSDTLSKAAGKIIFRRLVYATIDLGKSGAKTGEVLNVYLTWILDSKRDSLGNSPRLPIGKYYLRETGWKVDVADMFALVKRIDEDKVDPTKVSPSNFKGSGGAVLMWTYSKWDRGINIKPDGNDHKVSRKNRFMNFFEPSFGLNVSYLDFSTEKDVEIGTGLQLGLFKNKIFFGYGVNLHMLSPKNQSPTYFYLGFSFARLSDLFKDSPSVSSFQ